MFPSSPVTLAVKRQTGVSWRFSILAGRAETTDTAAAETAITRVENFILDLENVVVSTRIDLEKNKSNGTSWFSSGIGDC